MIERTFYRQYSVIFRYVYVSMWVGVFACVIGVDVLDDDSCLFEKTLGRFE